MNTFRKSAATAAIIAASLAGGALGASFVGSATAQTATTAPAATAQADPGANAPTGAPTGQRPQHDPSKGGHQANGVTETLLTGDSADQVTAAAKTAVPDGTIERVETDAEGAAYEAHVVKADGSHVTVTFNADYSVKAIEAGH